MHISHAQRQVLDYFRQQLLLSHFGLKTQNVASLHNGIQKKNVLMRSCKNVSSTKINNLNSIICATCGALNNFYVTLILHRTTILQNLCYQLLAFGLTYLAG